MKFIKTSFTAIITFLIVGFVQSCSAPKQIGDSDNYAFKNQSLTLISRIDFCHVNTFIDSTALRYKNKKHEEFQIRIPKLETYKTYKEMEKLGKISFTARNYYKNEYIINKETIKKETN